MTNQLVDVAEGIFSGHLSRVSCEAIPEYTLRELLTEERTTFRLKERFAVRLVSPVTGENFALSVKSVTMLDREANTSPGNLAFL